MSSVSSPSSPVLSFWHPAADDDAGRAEERRREREEGEFDIGLYSSTDNRVENSEINIE